MNDIPSIIVVIVRVDHRAILAETLSAITAAEVIVVIFDILEWGDSGSGFDLDEAIFGIPSVF